MKPKILIVDDEPNVRLTYRTALETEGLEVWTDSPEVFNLGGVLFEMLEDYDRAKRYYGQAIRLDRNYEPVQQNMRRIYELFHFGSSKEPFNLGEN